MEKKELMTARTVNGNLIVKRERVKDKDGVSLTTESGMPFYAYVVEGLVRGQMKKVDFVPKDKGGYEVLDILFGIADTAELVLGKEEMTDDKGKVTKYDTYKVRVYDEEGEAWECDIKPQRNSDKALLNFILKGIVDKGGVKTA